MSKNAHAEYFTFIQNLDSLEMAMLEIGSILKKVLTVLILIQKELKGINDTGKYLSALVIRYIKIIDILQGYCLLFKGINNF